MNKLNTKVIGTALTALMLALSAGSAQAAQSSTEQAISQFVMVQGKQLMSNVSQQLKQSIAQSVESFSIEQAVSWASDKGERQVAKKEESKEKSIKAEEE